MSGPSGIGPRLDAAFFDREATVVAAELIGCRLLARGRGGTIVETEAYDQSEPACHAYVGRTARTEVLFGPPARAYVYLSYGIHQLFNVVTRSEGHGAAVLIRAIEPTVGVGEMRASRRGRGDRELCAGPGRLTEALGIGAGDNRRDLTDGPIGLYGPPPGAARPRVVAGPRIGISKAADLPWRFCHADGLGWLSAPAG